MAKSIVKAIEMTMLAGTAFTATLQQMNPGGLPESCNYLLLVNDSTQDLYVSFDNLVYNFFLRSNSEIPLPSQANAIPNSKIALFPKGMGVWIASVSGAVGVGNVWLSGLYQPKE